MGIKGTIKGMLDQVRTKPEINERIKYWAYGPEFRRWCKSNPCASVPDRYALYQWLLEHTKSDGPIDYIEFGVSHGDSVRWWVDHNRHPETTFVGFDSFAGLPEKWQSWGEGSFSTGGKIPTIEDSRCKFVKGYFDITSNFIGMKFYSPSNLARGRSFYVANSHVTMARNRAR